MQVRVSDDITLEVERHGEPTAPAILLVMGLGMQLIAWPLALVDALVARGFQVIRFDNRDAGLSTQLDGRRGTTVPLAFLRARLGLQVDAPYLLQDMARDSLGLLDALGIARAHVVGASMGGMVAQLMAIHAPSRVARLTLLMTHSGDPWVAPPRPAAAAALLRRPPRRPDIEQLVDHYTQLFRVIGSPPPNAMNDADLRARMRASFSRAYRPAGTYRQLLAIIASGDRSRALRQLQVPTLVLHGADDPLVPPSAGRDLARKIPAARLALIDGMGHDLGPLARLTQEIGDFCAGDAADGRRA